MTEKFSARYYASGNDLKLFYRDYESDSARTPILCLPGLTRNSRDFECVADRYAGTRRVLAPDFRGRGYSAYDPVWKNYHAGTYVDDTLRLMDHAEIENALIIGTSLGGIVAAFMNARASDRVRGAVLNDVGPVLCDKGLQRILEYTGKLPGVRNWDEALEQSRSIYAVAWPDLDDAKWQKLTRRFFRENESGVPVLDMDPAIGDAIRETGPAPGDPWDAFLSLTKKPHVLLWGELSDLVTRAEIDEFATRAPNLVYQCIPTRGHAPLLDEPECIAAIDAFLNENP